MHMTSSPMMQYAKSKETSLAETSNQDSKINIYVEFKILLLIELQAQANT